MNLFKVLLAGAAVGVIVTAFRDSENETWLVPSGPLLRLRDLEGEDDEDEREPVLGYDGMDQDTLIEWLDDADLDPELLPRIRRYEAAHRNRGAVLSAIDDLR